MRASSSRAKLSHSHYLVSTTITKFLLKRGVRLRKVLNNVVFVCVCLRKVINVVNVSGIMTKCLFKKGVHLRKLNKVVFVCIWDHD